MLVKTIEYKKVDNIDDFLKVIMWYHALFRFDLTNKNGEIITRIILVYIHINANLKIICKAISPIFKIELGGSTPEKKPLKHPFSGIYKLFYCAKKNKHIESDCYLSECLLLFSSYG